MQSVQHAVQAVGTPFAQMQTALATHTTRTMPRPRPLAQCTLSGRSRFNTLLMHCASSLCMLGTRLAA